MGTRCSFEQYEYLGAAGLTQVLTCGYRQVRFIDVFAYLFQH
jgi:hypothetical protein